MSLTAYQKQIVELSLQGVKPAEIAKQLGRSAQSVYSTQDRLKKRGILTKDGTRFVPGPKLAEAGPAVPLVPPPTDTAGITAVREQAESLIATIDAEIEKRRQEIAVLEAQRKSLQGLVKTSSELFG